MCFKGNLNQKLYLDKTTRQTNNPSAIHQAIAYYDTTEPNLKLDQSTQANDREIRQETRNNYTAPPPPVINKLQINQNQLPPATQIPHNIYINSDAFINYTKLDIPANIAYILSMGPKFAAPLNATNDHKMYQIIEERVIELYEAHV